MLDVLGSARVYTRLQKSLAPDKAMHRLAALLGIRPGERVLDIGCGPADILEYLPPNVEYTGFDVSERYIRAAKRRYGKRGEFSVSAISPTMVSGEYDAVMAIGVLHHLDDHAAGMLFDLAANVLKPGGRVVTLDGVYVPRQNPIAHLLLRLDRGKYVRTEEAYLAIARRKFPETSARILTDLLTIPYTYCLMTVHSISHAE